MQMTIHTRTAPVALLAALGLAGAAAAQAVESPTEAVQEALETAERNPETGQVEVWGAATPVENWFGCKPDTTTLAAWCRPSGRPAAEQDAKAQTATE